MVTRSEIEEEKDKIKENEDDKSDEKNEKDLNLRMGTDGICSIGCKNCPET
jgi:hypothetical protein